MAFDSLSEKLQNVFKNLRSKGRLTEDDVKAALKEVKMALLEADVNFKVVKQFVKDVQERAIGQDVMNGLNPGQMVIKIVNEEMVRLMGSETTEIALRPGKELTIIMMAGLQGAGKTTTTAKIAGKLKAKGKKVLLAACDVYRPAAIEQLQINGEKQGVEVFSMGDKNTPVNIAKAAVEHATKNDFNVLIIDTAGRLHVDEDMMAELIQIKENVAVSQTILVVDAMTGQDAVNVAKMAFDSLSEKLQNVFKNLRSKGRLTEDDVKAALKEVKMALLEADVNFKVVKQFVKDVQERAIGQDVMNGLNPGQMVIKIVNEEMVRLMGSETTEIALRPGKELTIIMMAGLQGAGKTTTTAKIAGKLKAKGKKVLLAACDVYRPAAIEQLQINGEKQGVEVFSMGDKNTPVNIAKAAVEHATKNDFNVLIIDTAGRLHVDEDMMAELIQIKENVAVSQTILVVDAMTGQDAVNVAKTFDEKIGIDGVVLTKLDGDTRGGAALSIRAVTGKPILYAGMGEKLSDLEQFYPDRMASRILGMGDVLTLIEKAQNELDEEKAKKLEEKMRKNEFDFEMYLESMSQMKKMGGLSSILGMMPGLGGGKMPEIDEGAAEKNMARTEAIIFSMTVEERQNPSLLNPSRKRRIAQGAGVDIAEVNRLVKQFDQAKKMMKQMPGMMKKGKKGMFKGLPF